MLVRLRRREAEIARLAAALAEVTRERDEAERERQKSVESEARCLTRALKAESALSTANARLEKLERVAGELQAAIDDCDSWPRYSDSIRAGMDALHAALDELKKGGT